MGNPAYQRFTVAGTTLGPQAPVLLDWLTHGETTLAVWLAGAGAYHVEGTLDDLVPVAEGGQAGASNPARWFTLVEFPAATAASKYAGFANPWLWVRINIESIGADIEFKVQQAVSAYRL